MSLENTWDFYFKFRLDLRNKELQMFVDRIIKGDLRFDDNPIECEKLPGDVIRLNTHNGNSYSTRFSFYDEFSAFLKLVSPSVIGAAHVKCQVEGDTEHIYLGAEKAVAALKSCEALTLCRRQIRLLTPKGLDTLGKALAERQHRA